MIGEIDARADLRLSVPAYLHTGQMARRVDDQRGHESLRQAYFAARSCRMAHVRQTTVSALPGVTRTSAPSIVHCCLGTDSPAHRIAAITITTMRCCLANGP